MKSVWKFPLKHREAQCFDMPKGAEILHLEVQQGIPTLWALCDTETQAWHRRIIHIYGTGHEIPHDQMKHLGTFTTAEATFVWHVFEVLI